MDIIAQLLFWQAFIVVPFLMYCGLYRNAKVRNYRLAIINDESRPWPERKAELEALPSSGYMVFCQPFKFDWKE